MMIKNSTIQLDAKTKEELKKVALTPDESYKNIIKRLLKGENMNVSLDDNPGFSLEKGQIVNDSDFADTLIKNLNTTEKLACFLLGSLFNKVLKLDYAHNSKKLLVEYNNNFNGTYKDIQRLYPRLLKKLKKYDVNYPQLENTISANLLLSDKNWTLTSVDVKYYITLGQTTPYNK